MREVEACMHMILIHHSSSMNDLKIGRQPSPLVHNHRTNTFSLLSLI